MRKKIGILCFTVLCFLLNSTDGDPGRDLCKIISGGGLKCSKMSSYLFPYDAFLSFNDDLAQFTNEMRYLDIGNSNISILQSRSFQHMPNLSQLVLTNIFLKEIEPGAFEGLSRLKMVDLSNNLLQTVPVDVFKYTNIDWLSIQGNPLLEIPNTGSIFYARTLSSLNFRNCNIQRLPAEAFKENPNLVHLDLSRNKLKELPEQIFSFLHQLTFLDLSKNEFQTMDLKLFQLVPTFPKFPMTVLLSDNPLICDCRLSKLVGWVAKDIRTGNWTEKTSLTRLRGNVDCQQPNVMSWFSPEFRELMNSCGNE